MKRRHFIGSSALAAGGALLSLQSARALGQSMIVNGNARVGGNAKHGKKILPGGVLEITGNSLAQGSFMDGQEYGNIAAVLGRRFDAGYGPGRVVWSNDGYAGQTTEQMIAGDTFGGLIQTPQTRYMAGQHNVLVTWEVINSRLLASPRDAVSQAVDAIKTYCAARKSEGWFVATVTMSATPFSSNPDPDFAAWENTDRFSADTLMRAVPLGAYWDALADLAADPVVAANVQTSGAQTAHCENFLDCDNIHLSKCGTPYVCDMVFPLIITPFGFTDSQPTLRAKLKAYYPLWSALAQVNEFLAPDYWGNNNLGGLVTQSADYVTIPGGGWVTNSGLGAHTLHASNPFAYSLKFRPTAVGRDSISHLAGVWYWNLPDGHYEYLAYIAANSDKLSFKATPDGTEASAVSVTSTVTLTNNDWHFVEAGWTGTQIYISVDGENPVTANLSSIKSDSDSPFHIGTANPANNFPGDAKQLAVYTSPLTTNERGYMRTLGTYLFGG